MTDIDVTRPLKTKSGVPVEHVKNDGDYFVEEDSEYLRFRARHSNGSLAAGDILLFYRDGRYLRSATHEYDLIYADEDTTSSDMDICRNAVKSAMDVCERLYCDFHAIVGDLT